MITREDLYRVPVPEHTESYSPVPHRVVIKRIETQLHKNNMEIFSESFNVGRGGNQVIGLMSIEHAENKELGMQFAWQNSYDKSKAVAFAAGGHAWICMNGMIIGDIQFVRKHTGTVLMELTEKIQTTVLQLERQFTGIEYYSQQMKEIQVDKRLASELAGRLFIEEQLITAEQLSIIKREIIKPTFDDFRNNNLWSFYNHVTYSLKDAHPMNYLQSHKEFHQFVAEEFHLETV
jgi:hypothetical protein